MMQVKITSNLFVNVMESHNIRSH